MIKEKIFKKILVFLLFLFFVFFGNEIVSAREFPVESDISDVLATPTMEIKEAVVEEKTSVPKVSMEELTADWERKTSYELFWPVVAGKLPGDKLYFLKAWRDKLVEHLFFNKFKKSEYFKKLANKRLIEAEKLLELGRYSFLSGILKESKAYLEKGTELLSSLGQDNSFFWLRGEYAKDLRKHVILLERMARKAKGEEKKTIEESLKNVRGLIGKHGLEAVTF